MPMKAGTHIIQASGQTMLGMTLKSGTPANGPKPTMRMSGGMTIGPRMNGTSTTMVMTLTPPLFALRTATPTHAKAKAEARRKVPKAKAKVPRVSLAACAVALTMSRTAL